LFTFADFSYVLIIQLLFNFKFTCSALPIYMFSDLRI